MTATATKVTTLKMTVNVPVDLQLKYIDVWPNDPDKDPAGKGYGASVALKGTVNGEEYRIYPKGFVNKTIEKLVNAGVIEDGHYQHDPAEKYSIPVKQGNIRIVNAQPAGERYANFDIQAVNGRAVLPAPKVRATVPNAKPPVPSHANVPNSELPEFLRDADKQDNADLRAKISDVSEEILQRRESFAAAQFDTVRIALEIIEPLYVKKGIGLTDDVVHKHAFELFKMWCDKGLVG